MSLNLPAVWSVVDDTLGVMNITIYLIAVQRHRVNRVSNIHNMETCLHLNQLENEEKSRIHYF